MPPSQRADAARTRANEALLGGVAGVQSDVSLGQVAAVGGELAVGDAEIDGDDDVRARKVVGEPLQIRLTHGSGIDLLLAEADPDLLRVDVQVVLTLSDGHGDAAPVAVAGRCSSGACAVSP